MAGFSISEVTELTGISAFTIRYYDKCGFFPSLTRGKGGTRTFTQDDIDQLLLMDALRKSGLSIEGIQYFVRLQKQGSSTQPERLDILRSQVTNMEYQLTDLQACLERLRGAAMELNSGSSDQGSHVL